MNCISIFRGLATSVFVMILGTTTLQAKPHPQHSVKPITQPGNKHHSHPVNRPERPIRPPHLQTALLPSSTRRNKTATIPFLFHLCATWLLVSTLSWSLLLLP